MFLGDVKDEGVNYRHGDVSSSQRREGILGQHPGTYWDDGKHLLSGEEEMRLGINIRWAGISQKKEKKMVCIWELRIWRWHRIFKGYRKYLESPAVEY